LVRRFGMVKKSAVGRAIAVAADATGRTDEEFAVGLTVGLTAAALLSALLSTLHLLNFLEDWDIHVFG